MDAIEAGAVLARARQGDSDAFRVLVERHSRSVFRLAFRMTGNEQDAEDVVQESFLRAFRQLGRFESRQLRHLALQDRGQLLRGFDAGQAIAPEPGPIGHLDEIDADPAPPTAPRQNARAERGNRTRGGGLGQIEPGRSAAFTLRTTKDARLTKSRGRWDFRTSATKHSVFRAVRKLRIALAELK